jgi:hypothetical protein
MTTNETNGPATEPSAADAALRPGTAPLSETELTETEALAWLRQRGRVTMSNAELGRQWGGWHRQRVGRWLDTWCDTGD